ncbi:MAG: hypothetical protein KGN77_07645 [Xanthomonadaceae bacterium]|nr:hypothetical protein [Xanthomonadaceae bacterium]MDE1965390.1 hypothetical protein [Xanthomonadaceae bacterium]
MKQFIPLEDDWTLIESFFGHRLVPYQAGMSCVHEERMPRTGCDRATGLAEKIFPAPPSQPSGAAL